MFTVEFINKEENKIIRMKTNNIADAFDKSAYPPEGAKFIKIYFPGQEPQNWTNVEIVEI